MADGKLSFYRDKFSEYSDKLRLARRTQRGYVFLRLASFLIMIFLPLLFAGTSISIAISVFLAMLAVFLFLVHRFGIQERKVKYFSALLGVNCEEIEALRGNLDSFDSGSRYEDPDHRYSPDLDLFGENSMFHYMNRCCTVPGMDMLADFLKEPATDAQEIKRRQKGIKELAAKLEFCQHFIATGRMYGDSSGDRINLIKYVNTPSHFTRNRSLVMVSRVLPALTAGTLLLAAAGILPFYLVLILFCVQLGITGLLFRKTAEVHDKVTRSLGTLKKYGKLLRIIHDTELDAPLLKSIQRYLRTEGTPPSGHIAKLARIVDAFDNRLNFIAFTVLNGLLLWDVNCVLMLERWNRRNRKKLAVWLGSIAKMDAFISMAIFFFNNTDFVFPQPDDSGPVLRAGSLGHPLIPAGERVCNDLTIEDSGCFVIVTGANMAGKSTFLRTAGIALVLAMAGAPVCAADFRFRITDLYTSMRTSDSLSKHESYFYAELKRLKHLIETIAGGRQVFVLLDEILKGTNTTDKQKGSVALLGRMLGLGATGIIATHDLSLTSLENEYPGRIMNRCFEVDIDGDRISFDYRLREGVTRKMNALLLMEQMGLLPGKTPGPDQNLPGA